MSPSPSSTAQHPRTPWIHSRWIDLAFFIGVPLLLLPLILVAPSRPSLQELILYLGAFGALGHHLPGMLRAYGDRELFARFRVRLVLAPLFLVAVCVGFSVSGLSGVVAITFLWTTWHTLMQIYGFARIYDSKSGPSEAWTSRIDHAMCIAWIGAPLFYSDSRVAYALELYYRCGGPLIAPGAIDALRNAWLAFTAVASAAFVVQLLRSHSRGARANPVKLIFFAASFSFWWFCMVAVDHLVAGIALFDVFHDVQYLALVWMFQRSRVDRRAAVGGFTRFLFRSSGSLIGLYVGLVVAYGSLGYFSGMLASETVRNVLLGVLAASALFHFYLDGFIWKVRESSTREHLGIAGSRAPDPGVEGLLTWQGHAWKWTLFAVPLCLFAWGETKALPDPARWRASIAEATPRSAEALTSYGVLLGSRGELERALELHRRAIALKPSAPEPRNNLGVVLRQQGKLEEARASLEEAIRLRPSYGLAHSHLAIVLMRLGDSAGAELHFREAMRHDARLADPRAYLGVLLAGRGDVAAALPLLREALLIEPENRGALNGLAWILATTQRADLRAPEEALALALRFDRLSGHRLPQALDTLAAAQAATGDFEAAQRFADEGIRIARESSNEGLALQIESHRASYRAGHALLLP